MDNSKITASADCSNDSPLNRFISISSGITVYLRGENGIGCCTILGSINVRSVSISRSSLEIYNKRND